MKSLRSLLSYVVAITGTLGAFRFVWVSVLISESQACLYELLNSASGPHMEKWWAGK